MTRNRSTPFTTNSEAATLIKQAANKCPSCALPGSWRLKTGTFTHISGVQCKAVTERQALRDIAKKARANDRR